MKLYIHFLAFGVWMLILSGCSTQYSFGVKQLFPTEKEPKYSLYVGITPKEWPGSGIKRRALLVISMSEFRGGKRLISYKRQILASNLDYETAMTNGLLEIVARDKADPSSRWHFRFVRTQEGRFTLQHEDGIFDD